MVNHHYDKLIAGAVAEVGAGSDAPTPLETTLAELTTAAVQLIDGVDCADVLLIRDGKFQPVGATSPIAVMMDDVQEQTRQGPCLDAAEGDGVVRCNDLRNDRRWPPFARKAQAAGVVSVMSFRLYTHGSDSGALNLYGFGPRPFAAEPEALGAMLATHAALAIVAANRQHQFESALASRDLIGQAKGIIMERFDVDAMQAFALLRRISQETNTPVRLIAEHLATRDQNKSTG